MVQYIGPYKIKRTKEIDKETLSVEFEVYASEDGNQFQPPKRVYTYKRFNHIVKDVSTDFNSLMRDMYTPLVEEIVKSLVDYDCHIGFRDNKANDLEYVFKLVERKITNWRDTYEDRLWGSEEDEKTLRQLVQGLATVSPDIQELKVIKRTPKDPE